MDDFALERRKRRNDLYRKREAERKQRILEAQRTVPGQAYLEQEGLQGPPQQRATDPSWDEQKTEGPVRYVCGSEITKTSPSSSVSMSQSPETWSMKRTASLQPNAAFLSKKNIFSVDSARPKKKGRLLHPESDISDDEDLFTFSSRKEKKTAVQQKDVVDSPRKVDSDPPSSRKTKWIWEDLGNSSDSDAGTREQHGSTEQVAALEHSSHKSNFIPLMKRDRQERSQYQQKDATRSSSLNKAAKKIIRNPLVEEKAQREQTNVTLPSASATAPGKTSSLWDDSDSNDDNDDGGPFAESAPSAQSDTLVYEEDIQQLRDKMYPLLDRPAFGSEGPPVPLVLNDCYQVPASINRYLAEYQQEGTKFMFDKAIAIPRGCILADDMGLGKTVQTIALVAALLKKTGTEYDNFVLRQRRGRADERSRRIQREKEECLKAGYPYCKTTTYGDVVKELELPEMTPIMVVVPKSVVPSWEANLVEWGHFATIVYDGNSNRRELAMKGIENGRYEVVIVTYPTFQDNEKTAAVKDGQVRWKIVIIDEMHLCKNMKAEVTKNIRGLRDAHKSMVIGLTGTVMPNEHKELWNLVDLAAPDYLGPWSKFRDTFANPIKLSRQRKATKTAVEFGKQQKLLLDKLLLGEMLLRREKKDKLAHKLPPKVECVVFCELSRIQARAYSHALTLPDYDILLKSNAPCDCGVNKSIFLMYQQLHSRRDKLMFLRKWREKIEPRGHCCYRVPDESNQPSVLWRKQHPGGLMCQMCPKCILLPALSGLAKVSSHLSLIQAKEDPQFCIEGSTAYIKASLELSMAQAFLPKDVVELIPGKYIRSSSILNQHSELSGKFQYLERILDRIERQREKVLVFSNYTTPLDLIENFLESKGYAALRIDGSTPAARRKEIIDDFGKETGAFILLLSKKAMGVGVTLTEANNVIIFDVDWSPANDSQAQDRSYRIGQDRTVFVYRLVAKGTVEEMKYLRQLYKQDMTNQTLDAGIGEDAQRGQFRGVQKDKYRKGELFGLENLLKYKEGTFMNYKRNDALSKAHGFDLYDVGEIMETMKATNANDGVLPFDEDAAVLSGFEEYNVDRLADDEVDDEDDDAHLGGQSQAAMELLDDASPIDETANQGANGVSSANLSAIECLSTASMPSTGSLPTDNVQSTSTLILGRPDQISNLSKTMPRNDTLSDGLATASLPKEAQSTLPAPSVASPVKSARVNSASSPLKTGPSPVRSRPEVPSNMTLVGKTTAAIRRGETGKTSFSRSDLPIPGRSKHKKH